SAHYQYIHSFPTRRSSDLIKCDRHAEGRLGNAILAAIHARRVGGNRSDEDDSPVALFRHPPGSLLGEKMRPLKVGTGRRENRLRSEEHTSELQSPYDLVCR